MKAIALLGLLVFAGTISLRADILVNGNFADGHAHWKGDAKDPDTTTPDLSNPNSQGGVTITLKKEKWTKIYQSFTTREKKLHYSITFTLSSDYQIDHNQPENTGFARPAGLDDIEGVPYCYASNSGSWACIVAEGLGTSSFPIRPDTTKTASQTLSGFIHGAEGSDSEEMVLIFAFPPGEGSITITDISLTADTN
jgi:hypothetical protein